MSLLYFQSMSAGAAPTQDEPHTLRINQSSLLAPPAVIHHQAEQIANARRSAAQGSLEPYTIPLLATHRHGLAKIVSHGPSNLRYQRPQWRELLAGFPPFREQEGSRDLQKGYPSVTNGASSSAKHPSKVPFTKA